MGEGIRTDTSELRAKVDTLKKDVGELAVAAKDEAAKRVRAARDATADWATEHPVATLAIAAGIGAIIGFTLGRMCSGRRRD